MKWLVLLLCLSGALSGTGGGRSSSASSSSDELRLNAYTSDGELAQVAFASRGVGKSSPAVGFLVNGVGVLLHCSPCDSLLSQRIFRTIEWMDSVAICPIGYGADCLRVKTEWRGVVENHKFSFGEPPAVDKIASKLSTMLTSGLYPEQRGDDEPLPFARPLASSVLFLAAVDKQRSKASGNGNRLLLLDNSGAIFQCHKLASLGTISKHKEDLDAVASILLLARETDDEAATKSIVERVAAKLLNHVARAHEDAGVLDLECFVVDATGKGHVLPLTHTAAELAAELSKVSLLAPSRSA